MDNYSAKGDLIDLLGKGDCDGHSLAYTQYSPVLYGAINAIVKDSATSEKILKQVFIDICNNIDRYNPLNSSFLTWTLQVARSTSIAYIRSNGVQTGYLVKNGTDTSIELVSRDTNPTEHDILALVLAGYKAAEVAEKLNMPIDVVKVNIRKAIRAKANRA